MLFAPTWPIGKVEQLARLFDELFPKHRVEIAAKFPELGSGEGGRSRMGYDREFHVDFMQSVRSHGPSDYGIMRALRAEAETAAEDEAWLNRLAYEVAYNLGVLGSLISGSQSSPLGGTPNAQRDSVSLVGE